jgi:hypothetical protein
MNARETNAMKLQAAIKRNLKHINLRPKLKKPEPEARFPVEGVTYQLHEMPLPPKRIMGFKEWCLKVWDRREVLVDDPPAVK